MVNTEALSVVSTKSFSPVGPRSFLTLLSLQDSFYLLQPAHTHTDIWWAGIDSLKALLLGLALDCLDLCLRNVELLKRSHGLIQIFVIFPLPHLVLDHRPPRFSLCFSTNDIHQSTCDCLGFRTNQSWRPSCFGAQLTFSWSTCVVQPSLGRIASISRDVPSCNWTHPAWSLSSGIGFV